MRELIWKIWQKVLGEHEWRGVKVCEAVGPPRYGSSGRLVPRGSAIRAAHPPRARPAALTTLGSPPSTANSTYCTFRKRYAKQ